MTLERDLFCDPEEGETAIILDGKDAHLDCEGRVVTNVGVNFLSCELSDDITFCPPNEENAARIVTPGTKGIVLRNGAGVSNCMVKGKMNTSTDCRT